MKTIESEDNHSSDILAKKTSMRWQSETSTFPLSAFLISMFFFLAHLSLSLSLSLSVSLVLIRRERQTSAMMLLSLFFSLSLSLSVSTAEKKN